MENPVLVTPPFTDQMLAAALGFDCHRFEQHIVWCKKQHLIFLIHISQCMIQPCMLFQIQTSCHKMCFFFWLTRSEISHISENKMGCLSTKLILKLHGKFLWIIVSAKCKCFLQKQIMDSCYAEEGKVKPSQFR